MKFVDMEFLPHEKQMYFYIYLIIGKMFVNEQGIILYIEHYIH